MFTDLGDPAQKCFLAGGHRLVDPAETLERIAPLEKIFGITRVADVTGLDTLGVPVVMVCRPASRSLAVSQGKGIDRLSSRVSGLMEAIELAHAERLRRPLRLASHNELRCDQRTVDIEALPQLSVSAYHNDLRLLWVEGQDLLTGEPTWLPHELVHLDCTLPLPPGSGCFPLSSNGLASGNHPLEALVHGLCEVLERDAYSLWLAGGAAARTATRLDLESVDDPICREVLDLYARAGMAVAAWETTSDVGVASFRAALIERRRDAVRPVFASSGMGCHPAREVALLRALTEAAQTRLTLIAGSRDDFGRDRYPTRRDPEALAAVRAEIEVGEPLRVFHDVPSYFHHSFAEDLRILLERLRAVGVDEVIAVDLSWPVIELPVVRVVVPGLEGSADDVGYLPGRRAREILKARGTLEEMSSS